VTEGFFLLGAIIASLCLIAASVVSHTPYGDNVLILHSISCEKFMHARWSPIL